MDRLRVRSLFVAGLIALLVSVLAAATLSRPPDRGSGTEAVAEATATTPSAVAGSIALGSSLPDDSPVPASPTTAMTATPTPPPTSTSIRPGRVNATSMSLSAQYTATVRLGFGSRSFLVAETIVATNTSGKAIDRLELNTIAARLGGMRITRASVDGKPVHPTVTDQTIHLPLGGILDEGATATIRLGYRARLRATTSGSTWLFTRANGIVEAHRWLPWISKPTPFNRPNHGDPFVTGVSPRVRVTIISDRAIRWATTGEQVGGSGVTKVFEARNVRDFAFTGAPDYRLRSVPVGGVVVHAWGRPGFPIASVLTAAKSALSREAALLGAYPYRTYDVAQTAGGFGMESPGLTWIPTGAGSLTYLVAHETAHQWFYGVVGNDQARQPFDDEAAADFVARYVTGLRRASRCSTTTLDRTIYQYSSACYYEDIYIQGGNLLDDTRKAMGSTRFWAAIRDYLAANRFKIATTQKLLTTLDAHTSLNLGATRFARRFPAYY